MGSDLDGPFRFGGPCGKEIALDAFGSFPDFSLAVPHEAEVAHLTALTEGLGALEIDIVEATIVDDITAAEHRAETLKESVFAEFIPVQASQRLKVVVILRVLGMPDVFPTFSGAILEPEGNDFPHEREEER